MLRCQTNYAFVIQVIFQAGQLPTKVRAKGDQLKTGFVGQVSTPPCQSAETYCEHMIFIEMVTLYFGFTCNLISYISYL